MITYNDLYESLRKERYSEQLQKLPKNFISDVGDYFAEKKQITQKQDDMFSDSIMKSKKQFENAVAIFRELILRRKKKLLNLAFVAAETGISKRDFENMLSFEKELFEKIMASIENADKKLNENINGKKEVKPKHKLIVFNENVDEFLGLDGEKLGPFQKGQLANLPEEISKILIEDKKASYADEND